MFQDPRQAGGPDPNILSASDWMNQEAKIKRTLALAQALREQGKQPQGQMVSGHYVAPSWAEQLLPVFNQFQAGWSERQADEAQKALSSSQEAESEGWMKAMPKAQNVPFQAPGIDEADAAAASAGMQTRTEPTQAENLAWAQRGMRNPLSRTLAQMQMGEFVKQPEREEQRAFRKEEAAAQRANALQIAQEKVQAAAEAARLRSEDTRLSIEQRREAAREATALRAQLGQMAHQIATTNAESRRMEAEAKAAKAAGGDLKPLPGPMAKSWMENNVSLKKVGDALTEVEANPQAFGAKRAAGALGGPGAWLNDKMDPAGRKARQLASELGSMKIHERSGAAVSAREDQRLAPWIPNVYDDYDTVLMKLQNFKNVYETIQQETADFATGTYKLPSSTAGDWQGGSGTLKPSKAPAGAVREKSK